MAPSLWSWRMRREREEVGGSKQQEQEPMIQANFAASDIMLALNGCAATDWQ